MAEGDFEFSCTACGGRLLGSPPEVGQIVQCSYCSAEITVPAAAAPRPAMAPPPMPYGTPPPPPAWPPPPYGAPPYGATPYSANSYGANPYGIPAYPPPGFGQPLSRRRNPWPLVVVLIVLGVLVGAGVLDAMSNRISTSTMTAHWSLTKSATGKIASARMDLNSDGTFAYQCTNIGGRSFRANGTWRMLSRQLEFTVRSSTTVSPFGNSTLLRFDVREVNGQTLHLHVKEGEQYWKRL